MDRRGLMNADWSKIIESSIGPLLGTLVGGSLTLGGIITKEWFDRRRATQASFQKYYLHEGIDVLISYLDAVTFYFRAKYELDFKEPSIEVIEAIPLSALSRFGIMLIADESK